MLAAGAVGGGKGNWWCPSAIRQSSLVPAAAALRGKEREKGNRGATNFAVDRPLTASALPDSHNQQRLPPSPSRPTPPLHFPSPSRTGPSPHSTHPPVAILSADGGGAQRVHWAPSIMEFWVHCLSDLSTYLPTVFSLISCSSPFECTSLIYCPLRWIEKFSARAGN